MYFMAYGYGDQQAEKKDPIWAVAAEVVAAFTLPLLGLLWVILTSWEIVVAETGAYAGVRSLPSLSWAGVTVGTVAVLTVLVYGVRELGVQVVHRHTPAPRSSRLAPLP